MRQVRIFTMIFLVMIWTSDTFASQSLTLNDQDVEQVMLKVGQSVTVEINSDDLVPYSAYAGFDDGVILGSFEYSETRSEAGSNASYSPVSSPDFEGYYVTAGGISPPPSPGVHFVFTYTGQETGTTEIKLYDATFTIELDSIEITVVSSEVGTGFSYQGRLLDDNEAADREYDFRFEIYDSPMDGNQIGESVDVNELDVIDGYFTTELDFGGSVFGPNAVWLQIEVRPGELEDPNIYTILNPRQNITPAPYALYAFNGSSSSLWQVNDADIYYNDGNVGIGTVNPADKLHVQNTDGDCSASIRCRDTNTSSLKLFEGTGYGYEFVYDGNEDKLHLWSRKFAGNEDIRMTWLKNGNIGIGTTSPARDLHIADAGYAEIELECTIEPANKWHISVATDSLDFLETGIDYRMTLENGGNIGIGKTNPETKLHVYESSPNDVYTSVEASDSDAEAGIQLKNPVGGWDIFANDGDGDLGIACHSLARRVLTIENSTGNVSIEGTIHTDSGVKVGASTYYIDGAIDTNSASPFSIGDTNATTVTIGRDGQNAMFPGSVNVSAYSSGERLSVENPTADASNNSSPRIVLKAYNDSDTLESMGLQLRTSTPETRLSFINKTGSQKGYIDSNGNIQASGNIDIGGMLTVGGSVALPVTKKSTNYTASASDYFILADASGGTITISLPNSSMVSGRIYVVKRIDNTLNFVYVDDSSGGTIDGLDPYPLNAQYKFAAFISDGTRWWVISSN